MHLVCLSFSSDEKLAGEAKDYMTSKKKKSDSVSWRKLDLICSTYCNLVKTNLSVTYFRGAALIYSQEGNVNSSISPLHRAFCCGPEKSSRSVLF